MKSLTHKRVLYKLLTKSHFTVRTYKNLAAKLMQIDAVIAENTNDGLFPAFALMSRFPECDCSLDSSTGFSAALQLAYTDTARKIPSTVACRNGSDITPNITVTGMNVVTKSAFWINFAKAVRRTKERRMASGGMNSKTQPKPRAAETPTKRERDPLTLDAAASPMLITAKERKRVSKSALSGTLSTIRV